MFLPAAAKTMRVDQALPHIPSLAVGPRERVVIVDCGGQQLLLGVTQHSVNLLHTLPEPLLDAPTQAGFAELLARLKARDSA